MEVDHLTIEDVLDMEPKQRDRLCARWIGDDINHRIEGTDAFCMIQGYWKFYNPLMQHPELSPKYSVRWSYAGRVLEALPFDANPQSWWARTAPEHMPTGRYLKKESIVLAACVCAIKDIEPNTGEKDE